MKCYIVSRSLKVLVHKGTRLIITYQPQITKVKLIRVLNEIGGALSSEVEITYGDLEDANKVSAAVKSQLKTNHTARNKSMAQHGLVKRKQCEVEDHDEQLTNCWLNEHNIPGHIEGYIFAIQEQEINNRALQKSREQKNNIQFNTTC